MSDPRFARLKNDPRFRRIRKHENKVVVDDRFKSVFDDGKKKKKGVKKRVDKYGRPLTDTHETDHLRRFYRLENEDEEVEPKRPDFARGEVLLESSDEEPEEDNGVANEDESDNEGTITLGQDSSKPIPIPKDDVEIDLNEDNFADLDAQAAEYSKAHDHKDQGPEIERTRRLAIVNLDWDHVRAIHLYKIFSSLVSPTAPAVSASAASSSKAKKANGASVVRGRVLSVRVYPSQFGKERMAREEREGPPPELFKKKVEDEEEINETTIFETGNGEDYDEDALRQYQLERLRYYYAIAECDTVGAASHIFTELEGTELERSANVFDLSFVPDEMIFDDEPRDEATDDLNVPYRPVEFVTDALRHSKVKLTWDEDDPERAKVTRRTLTRQELEEDDFKAYVASSSESSDEEESNKKKAERDRLRALLLSGDDDTLPEGWGKDKDDKDDEGVDMEITFTPGLTGVKENKDETTLEAYQRKMREKKKKRKEERKQAAQAETEKEKPKAGLDDEFFGGSSDEEEEEVPSEQESDVPSKRGKKGKKQRSEKSEPKERVESTAEELALIAASDNPAREVKHFSMKAVVKAEKLKGKKLKRKDKKKLEQENELQEDFSIDVQDERFKSLHEDHAFAIDPSNPHFKKTKGMAVLLSERSKRQKEQKSEVEERVTSKGKAEEEPKSSLKSLVESVKRKSAAADQPAVGKRRKL